MEPLSFSALLGCGGAALASVELRRRLAEKRRRLASSLPETLSGDQGSADQKLRILALTLHRARLPAEGAEGWAKIRIKYGPPGRSTSCEMAVARAAASTREEGSGGSGCVVVPLGTVCLFHAQDSPAETRLRIQVSQVVSGRASSAAKAELRFPCRRARFERSNVPLMASSGCSQVCFGHLDVAVALSVVRYGELRDCLLRTFARRQGGALLVGPMPPLTRGALVGDADIDESGEGPEVIMGRPLRTVGRAIA